MLRDSRVTTVALAAMAAVAGWLVASGALSRLVSAQSGAGLKATDPAPSAGSTVLPPPSPPFQGRIGLRASDSRSDFPQPVHAPKGAPNILLVLLDDVGFGASSTFGGPCSTPTLETLARNGLRYNQFHTTALC